MNLVAAVSPMTCAALVTVVLVKPSVRVKGHNVNIFWVVPFLGAAVLMLCGTLSPREVFTGLTAQSSINPLKILVLLLVITQTDSNAITRKNANEHAKKRLVKGISVQFKAIFKAEMQRAICKSFWAVFGLFEGSGAHSTILFKKSLKHL